MKILSRDETRIFSRSRWDFESMLLIQNIENFADFQKSRLTLKISRTLFTNLKESTYSSILKVWTFLRDNIRENFSYNSVNHWFTEISDQGISRSRKFHDISQGCDPSNRVPASKLVASFILFRHSSNHNWSYNWICITTYLSPCSVRSSRIGISPETRFFPLSLSSVAVSYVLARSFEKLEYMVGYFLFYVPVTTIRCLPLPFLVIEEERIRVPTCRPRRHSAC